MRQAYCHYHRQGYPECPGYLAYPDLQDLPMAYRHRLVCQDYPDPPPQAVLPDLSALFYHLD